MRAFKFIVIMGTKDVGRDNRSEVTTELLVIGTKMMFYLVRVTQYIK